MQATQPLFQIRHSGNRTGRILTIAEAREHQKSAREYPAVYAGMRLEPVAVAPANPTRAAAAMKAVREIACRRNTRTADGRLFTPGESKRLEKIKSRLREIRFLSARIGNDGKPRGTVEISGASGAAVYLRHPRVHPGAERRHIEPVAIVSLAAGQRREAMRLLRRDAA